MTTARSNIERYRETFDLDASKQAESTDCSLLDLLGKTLERVFTLGQNYWADADSESYAANRRSVGTLEKFRELKAQAEAEVRDLRAQLREQTYVAVTRGELERLREVAKVHREVAGLLREIQQTHKDRWRNERVNMVSAWLLASDKALATLASAEVRNG